jgi:hypothetical protein
MGWRDILAALIGAIIGGTITAGVFLFTSTQVRQETTARQLLSEVVALVSLQEAWLLQGDGSRTANLSDNPGLLEAQTGSGLRLLPVELRAILDEAQWNSPSDPSYGFYKGVRFGLSEMKYCQTLRFHIRVSPRSISPP